MLPTRAVPFLPSPSPRPQRLFAAHLLFTPEALPFIHSFLPPSSAHVHFLTRKTILDHPRSYQPHFGTRKRTIPYSGLTRKHTASKTKTTLETSFQCSQPALPPFLAHPLPTFIQLFSARGASIVSNASSLELFIMKSTTASLIIALASTAIAQPHGHHQHQHPARAAHQHHHKRDLVTEWDTVWVTETVTELVDDTTTEWFTPTPSAPSTTLATVTSSAGGQFFEGASAAPSSAPQVVAPAPAAETPSSPPAVVEPAPVPTTSSSSSSVYVAPQPTVAPVETPSPAPVAPVVETPAAPSVAAVNTPAAAANTPAASANTGSTVNTNTNAASALGSDFQSGDLTYYTVGLGACGEDDSGKDMSSNIVAMSSATMGSQSNGNPMCGKTIKIYNNANGKTSTGIIRDKCPGCNAGSIDVSQKLFEELADLADGRIDISWNWAS